VTLSAVAVEIPVKYDWMPHSAVPGAAGAAGIFLLLVFCAPMIYK